MNMSRVQSQEDEFRNNIFNFASYNEPAKAKWSIVSKASAEWTKESESKSHSAHHSVTLSSGNINNRD